MRLFKNWEIELKLLGGEWHNFIVFRPPSGKKSKIKKRKGDGVVCIAAERNRFHLAWNGKRLAQSKETKEMEKRFPALFMETLKYLHANYPSKEA